LGALGGAAGLGGQPPPLSLSLSLYRWDLLGLPQNQLS
jgi:hypothetical protein